METESCIEFKYSKTNCFRFQMFTRTLNGVRLKTHTDCQVID